MTINDTERRAYATLAVSTMLMGSAFTASKYVVGDVPDQVAALLRFGLGGLVMLGCLAALGRGVTLPGRDLVRVGFAGCFGIFGYNALFFWGLSLAPSIDGSVIVPILSPVITAGLGAAFLGQRATPARVAGLVVGVAGAVCFLVGAATGGHSVHRVLGDLVYLAAAASWAIYTLMGKRLLVGIDPLKTTTWATLAGSVLLVGTALPQFGDTHWARVPGSAWAVVAYLVVGPTVIAYAFYYQGVKMLGPTTASLMLFLAPLVGAVGGVVFLNESLTWIQVSGAALMVIGALFAITHPTSTPAQPTAAEGGARDLVDPARR